MNSAFTVMGNGTSVSDDLLLRGTAASNCAIAVHDGTTMLGTTTADASGAWAYTTAPLSDSLHALTATCALMGNTSPASSALDVTVAPDITVFNATSGQTNTVDGEVYLAENANQSYSLTKLDSHTLRFEVRQNDQWANDPISKNRSELDGYMNLVSPGTTVNVTYEFMIEPGPVSTAGWFVIGQFHGYMDGYSPPFSINFLTGDHMAVVIGWLAANPSPLPSVDTQGPESYGYAYNDSNPIMRNHWYAMTISANFDPKNGFLDVWRDGVQIVNYKGPFGIDKPTYWKFGAYRANAQETTAIQYRNMQVH